MRFITSFVDRLCDCVLVRCDEVIIVTSLCVVCEEGVCFVPLVCLFFKTFWLCVGRCPLVTAYAKMLCLSGGACKHFFFLQVFVVENCVGKC